MPKLKKSTELVVQYSRLQGLVNELEEVSDELCGQADPLDYIYTTGTELRTGDLMSMHEKSRELLLRIIDASERELPVTVKGVPKKTAPKEDDPPKFASLSLVETVEHLTERLGPETGRIIIVYENGKPMSAMQCVNGLTYSFQEMNDHSF